jgi:hypothetical protein
MLVDDATPLAALAKGLDGVPHKSAGAHDWLGTMMLAEHRVSDPGRS